MKLYVSNIGEGEFAVVGEPMDNRYLISYQGFWIEHSYSLVDPFDLEDNRRQMRVTLPEGYLK